MCEEPNQYRKQDNHNQHKSYQTCVVQKIVHPFAKGLNQIRSLTLSGNDCVGSCKKVATYRQIANTCNEKIIPTQ